MHDTVIRLKQTLHGVTLGDPNSPLPGSSAGSTGLLPPALSAADQEAQRQADWSRQHQQEREAIEGVLAGLKETMVDMQARRRQLLGEMQQVAVELAVAVASRLIHEKIEANDLSVETLVRAVVGRLGAKTRAVVRLHPEDLALLARRLGDKPRPFDELEVQLEADPGLARGDCRAEAGDISVLSEIEVQLDEIRRHLLRSLTDAQIERQKTVSGDRELRHFPDRRQIA